MTTMNRTLHIEGRRWFQRGPGNTYHSVRIWKDGEQIVTLPYQYGYGDCYLQTALDWLRANGHLPDVCSRHKPVFSGDPRGSVLKIRVPDGFTNDMGQEGICVPS